MKRKITNLLAVLALMLVFALVLPGHVYATGADAGSAEASNSWDPQTGTLKITTMGMANSASDWPWYEFKDEVKVVIIEDGVTTIGDYAFQECTNLTSISVPLSVTAIADTAFPADTEFEMYGWLNHASGAYAEKHDNVALKLKELRLLLIGNSHTDDYGCYFETMIGDLYEQMDTTVSVHRVLAGGRQLICDEESTRSHYLIATDPSIDLKNEGLATYSDYANAFAQTWDMVLIQDYRESVKYGAEYADDLQRAVQWIHESAPGAKVVWIADWAEPNWPSYKPELGFECIKAVQALSEDKPDLIISLNTIVENARTSYFGSVMNAEGVSPHATTAHDFAIFERDPKHLSLELGRYTAGVGVMYHMIQYLEDMLILEDGFEMFELLNTEPVFDGWNGEFVDEYWVVIEETARNSYAAPLEITQSKYTAEPMIEKIAAVLTQELPRSAVKEGKRVTEDIVKKVNAATGLNTTVEDYVFYQNGDTYTATVDFTYGYSDVPQTLAFLEDSVVACYKGLFKHEGNYYYLNDNYTLATGVVDVKRPNKLVKNGKYSFADDGKMVLNGAGYWVSELCYLVDGVPTAVGVAYDEKEDCFYYARSGGKICTGEYTVYANRTNGLIPAGKYDFGPDGKLYNTCENFDHNWVDATCTTSKTCARCDLIEGEALGHKWVDATCTTAKTCSACEATEGEALGHKWVDATCAAPKTCSACEATEGEALGHKWEDATCTTAKTCSVCEATEGEALGHKWVDATCTTIKTCSVCEATEGEALGHNWTDATCTVPKTCSVCDVTEGDPLGHDMGEWVTTKEPTTTAEGEKTRTCKHSCGHAETEKIPMIEQTDGWAEENGKWYYYKSGKMLKNEWIQSGSRWYYLDADGVMATGWVKTGGKWYYMDASGAMQTGWKLIGGKWYYLNSHMRTGWIQSGGKWYYMDASGAMQTGWEQVGGKWYYLDASGAMQTSWKMVGGKWYYLGSDGSMKTGWQYTGGKWYYMDASGAMQTGWKLVGGKWYYLGSDGAMRTGWVQQGGTWYYLNSSGEMVTGTQTIGGKTYKFNSSGAWVG